LGDQPADLTKWKEFVRKLRRPQEEVTIGLVGKYIELHDAYKSIAEAFIHAGAVHSCKVKLEWIQSERFENDNNLYLLQNLHGILVAPGFGGRGIDGKIKAVRYARENQIPFFGICLGMQCASVEFARNVLGIADACSSEIDSQTPNPVIDIMEEQKNITQMGGTMRLGSYPCQIRVNTKAHEAYQNLLINERHRHRYEFNNKYLDQFEEAGMICSGINPESKLVEIIELQNHPYFVGTQFHPELKSTVENPHPLFVSFVKAALNYALVQSEFQLVKK
jgi:CTP synthase